MTNYDASQGSPAAGGVEVGPMEQAGPAPEDSPNLLDPTNYPEEPITSGLPVGAGPGPQRDTRMQETANLRKYLPLLELYIDRPETPDSVRTLFKFIRAS